MNSIELITKSLLEGAGCYYRGLGKFQRVKTLNKRRIKNLTTFIVGLERSTEWLTNNVEIITNNTANWPPTAYRQGPYLKIGNSGQKYMWAVVKPPATEIEFLEDFLDEFICDPSGFERDLEAYDHVEDITKALKDRLTLIKGE